MKHKSDLELPLFFEQEPEKESPPQKKIHQTEYRIDKIKGLHKLSALDLENNAQSIQIKNSNNSKLDSITVKTSTTSALTINSINTNAYATASSTTSTTSTASSTWINPSETVNIANYVISSGLFYTGSGGKQYLRDISRINPDLPVTEVFDCTLPLDMNHFDYEEMTPNERGTYLYWLANGRIDRKISPYYVLLFICGLERRIILDIYNHKAEKSELVIIRKELNRILTLYGKFLQNTTTKVYKLLYLADIMDESLDLSDPVIFGEWKKKLLGGKIQPQAEISLKSRIVTKNISNKHKPNTGFNKMVTKNLALQALENVCNVFSEDKSESTLNTIDTIEVEQEPTTDILFNEAYTVRKDEYRFFLHIAVSRLAKNSKPVLADLACEIALVDKFYISLKPVSEKDFSKIFCAVFNKLYPNGITPSKGHEDLSYSYYPISPTLQYIFTLVYQNPYPDPVQTSYFQERIKTTSECTVNILDKYSAFLKKHPQYVNTFESDVFLPISLWPQEQQNAYHTLVDLFSNSEQDNNYCLHISQLDLFSKFWMQTPDILINKQLINALQTAFSNDQLFLETYPAIIGDIDTTWCSLYKKESDFYIPKREEKLFTFLQAFLVVSTAIAGCDSLITDAKCNNIRSFMNNAVFVLPERQVSPIFVQRLKKLMELLFAHPLAISACKKDVLYLKQQEKEIIDVSNLTLEELLLNLILCESKASITEISAIKRIYKWLKLDTKELDEKLKNNISKPVTEEKHQVTSYEPFSLNIEKIKQLRQETQELDTILFEIFDDSKEENKIPLNKKPQVTNIPDKSDKPQISDIPTDSTKPQVTNIPFDSTKPQISDIPTDSTKPLVTNTPEQSTSTNNNTLHTALPDLSFEYIPFLTQLLSKEIWTRQEIEKLANECNILTDGAIEAINDSCYNALGDALIEDNGDSLELLPDIKEQLNDA